jgi:hypothetical protein
MGKATYKGLVPRDDPMFSTGPEVFSRLGSSESLKSSQKSTSGETTVESSSATDLPETEAEGKELGARRIARYKHQTEQFRQKG